MPLKEKSKSQEALHIFNESKKMCKEYREVCNDPR